METKPKVLGVIPARLNSKRIREKMVADICGKPLIQWTIERSQQAALLDALVVATDSDRVAEIVRSLGVAVIMTPESIATGTDRVAYAVKEFKDFTPDIVVTIWGDEPLYPASAIDACVEELIRDPEWSAVGLADKLTDENLWRAPSVVKVLTDLKGGVLAFSRAPAPHPHNPAQPFDHYHITGALAMHVPFLGTYTSLSQGPLELREGIEQWRILEHGYRMKVIKGEFGNLGVNEPHELDEVRRIIESRISSNERYL